jgi:hypothetical protein
MAMIRATLAVCEADRRLDEAAPVKLRDETFAALRLDVTAGRAGWSSYRIEYERPFRRFFWLHPDEECHVDGDRDDEGGR